jgi:beta-N-acetylhexosaminidase
MGSRTIAETCGSLLVGAFDGTSLPAPFARALSRGERGGVVLFRRNLENPAQAAVLCAAVREAARSPALLAVDQEGGRVARLGAPLLEVPPMRTVASWGDLELAERIARAVGGELAAIGFDVDFAPVLDVNTRADNPVIGDRAFGDDAEICARFGAAWVRGMQASGLLACGKHFPGHGDTSKDSHLDLPIVTRSRQEIERVDLAPFRAAVAAGVATLMTAHVVHLALDPERPATLSRVVCSDLRARIGFRGVLFSDDLEMRAITGRFSVGEAAVLSIGAGCDAVLVCATESAQELALAALIRESEASPAFRARCEEAHDRMSAAQRRAAARARPDGDLDAVLGGPRSRAVAAEMAGRLAS